MNLEEEIINLYKLIFEIYKVFNMSLLFAYRRGKKRNLKKEEIDLMITPIFIARTLLGSSFLTSKAPSRFKKELIEATFNKKISEIGSKELMDEFLLEKGEAEEILKEINHPNTEMKEESRHKFTGLL